MNHVTAKKMAKRVRDIMNSARAKLPRTEWIGEGVGAITLISPSPGPLPTDSVPGLRIVGLEREAVGVGSRSSLAMDGISGLLPSPMLEGVGILEENSRDCCCSRY